MTQISIPRPPRAIETYFAPYVTNYKELHSEDYVIDFEAMGYDVWLQIASYLCHSGLLACRAVCRQWRTIFTHDSFWKNQWLFYNTRRVFRKRHLGADQLEATHFNADTQLCNHCVDKKGAAYAVGALISPQKYDHLCHHTKATTVNESHWEDWTKLGLRRDHAHVKHDYFLACKYRNLFNTHRSRVRRRAVATLAYAELERAELRAQLHDAHKRIETLEHKNAGASLDLT